MTLLFLSAAFLLGVISATHMQASVAALALFAVASVLMLALILTFRRSPFPALLLLALLLGMLRMETFDRDGVSALAVYYSRLPVAVTGVVSGDPEAAGTATSFRLRVNEIRRGHLSEPVTDRRSVVLVTLRETSELVQSRTEPYFRYGDRLLLEGPLKAPPDLEDFNYPAFLARQGIGEVMSFPEATLLGEGEGSAFYRWLYGLRRRIAVSLTQVVPEPQASVGQALLLGIRDDLPEEMVDDFRATGASHLLAISGLHMGGPAGGEHGRKRLGIRTPSQFLPAPPLRPHVALRPNLRDVAFGDPCRDHGDRVPGRAPPGTASKRATRTRIRRRRDGGGQPERALERVLPAQLRGGDGDRACGDATR